MSIKLKVVEDESLQRIPGRCHGQVARHGWVARALPGLKRLRVSYHCEMARIVGIKDVARDAGVSVGTVSNAINRPEMVAPETRDRVQAAIERLGYVRSEAARSLRAGRAAVSVSSCSTWPTRSSPTWPRAPPAPRWRPGCGSCCATVTTTRRKRRRTSLFAEQRVRGVLLTPADPTGADLAVLRRHEIPFVLVDQGDVGGLLGVRRRRGGRRMAGAHLFETGHELVAYVSGPMSFPQCRDRRDGARAALLAHGLPEDALVHIEADRMDVASGRDAGRGLLKLSRVPTAVFCANDLLALGVLQALYTAGVSVPGEMAIVGYDDIEFAAPPPSR